MHELLQHLITSIVMSILRLKKKKKKKNVLFLWQSQQTVCVAKTRKTMNEILFVLGSPLESFQLL